MTSQRPGLYIKPGFLFQGARHCSTFTPLTTHFLPAASLHSGLTGNLSVSRFRRNSADLPGTSGLLIVWGMRSQGCEGFLREELIWSLKASSVSSFISSGFEHNRREPVNPREVGLCFVPGVLGPVCLLTRVSASCFVFD